MKTTVKQLKQLVNEEMGNAQQVPASAHTLVDALTTWHGLVEKGLFTLPDKFARALRHANPQQKQALQAALAKIQDATHTLQTVVDDLKAVRGAK